MWINDNQGHDPNDGVELAGLGCLGFVLVCGALLLWWCVSTLWVLLS